MLNELVEWLKHIAVFMIVCETMLSFSPTKTYKRYIKPFVGLVLLLRIAVFLVGTVEIDWNERVSEVFDHYEQSVSRYLEVYPVIEEKTERKLNEDIIKITGVEIDNIEIGGSQ